MYIADVLNYLKIDTPYDNEMIICALCERVLKLEQEARKDLIGYKKVTKAQLEKALDKEGLYFPELWEML